MRILLSLCMLAAVSCWTLNAAAAQGVYQAPEEFVRDAFSGDPPAAKVLWITQALEKDVESILGHAPPARRVRYWLVGERSAWILEEIGKEQPITVGLVVNRGKLETVKVLVFRESRGWEVKHPFFTDQFRGAQLKDDQSLDRHIDGISGATLSVRALTKLARLALYYDGQVRH